MDDNKGIFDPRPKRRKAKDNPYSLSSIGKGTGKPKYIVFFKDGSNKEQLVEVNKEVFDAFDRFELEDLSELNKSDNHPTEPLDTYAIDDKKLWVDSELPKSFQYEELLRAINQLSDRKKKHLIMHFYEGYSIGDIAKKEGRTYQGIRYSIKSTMDEIKEYMSNC